MIGVFANGTLRMNVAVIAENEDEAVLKLRRYGDRHLPNWKLVSTRTHAPAHTATVRERQEQRYRREHPFHGRNEEIGRGQ
jgi:hypothetical protein